VAGADGTRASMATYQSAFALHPRERGSFGEVISMTTELLNGQLAGAPVAVSWAPNRLDVFAVGTDQRLWHWWRQDGGDWGGPEPRGGSLPAEGVEAVSWGPNRLDVFAAGQPGNQLYHWWWDGSSWGGPEPRGGNLPAESISAVSWGPNRLDVFAPGQPGNQLYHWWWDGSSWGGPEPRGGNMNAEGVSAVSWGPNRLDVFGVEAGSGQLLHWWWDGSSWGGPQQLGGSMRAETVSAVSWGPNRLDVFGVESGSGQLLHWWWDGSSWSGPEHRGGNMPAEGVSAVSSGVNKIDVFGIAAGSGQILRWSFDITGWTDAVAASPDASNLPAGDLSAVYRSWNQIDVFARAGNGSLLHWAGSSPSTINWPWAIILCKFNDKPSAPQPPDYYVDLFTRNGTGGVSDYWREVTQNALDLTGSEVFGWFTMNHSSTELPTARSTLVQWGIDTARANGINLARFKTILVVQNFGGDHGFAGNGVLIVHKDPQLCEFGFICHETGHGFGLPHSFSANPDVEYGDGWDVMSWDTTTFDFQINFRGAQGKATVGLNARNLEALNAVPARRGWVQTQPDFSEQITLDPLNQTPMGSHGFLVAKIAPNATQPRRPNDSWFTLECRRKAGWDQSIPENAILVHEVRTNGLSYLQPLIGVDFTAGQQFVTPDPKVFVQVTSIDSTLGTATLRLWDVPEGGLRKEDSNPRVFLIQNGAKRWVTSPDVLFGLGKTWSDVRVVPDGGLNSIPAGPDVT
jgi:hypothetical protein